MSTQKIFKLSDRCEELKAYINHFQIHRIFLICGNSVSRLKLYNQVCKILEELQIEWVHFADFCPNPQYLSVEKGVQVFCEKKCDGILAIGGGSAIDVAKCVKLYACMDAETDFLEQECRPNNIPFIVLPTTAGSGSEATRFAVIYKDGKKLSITHEELLPSIVIQYSDVLNELPLYQKKATVLDALCHCMESFWSVNSTAESREYAARGMTCILENVDGYLSGDPGINQLMMDAAYMAGRAINIAKTTACHAMSYKLTDLFSIAHGHAVSLCVDKVLPYMLAHMEEPGMCLDERGCGYLRDIMLELSQIMGGKSVEDSAEIFHRLLIQLNMDKVLECSQEELEILTVSVNTERLKNHPVKLDDGAIKDLYRQMASKGDY